MRYFCIDADKDMTDIWETECATAEEAIKAAQASWDLLTVSERKERILTAAEVDDDYGTVMADGSVKSDIRRTLWEGWYV